MEFILKSNRKQYTEQSIRMVLKKHKEDIKKLGLNINVLMNFSREVVDEFFFKQMKLIQDRKRIDEEMESL